MLKRMSIKKIVTSSIVLAIVFMVYLIPKPEPEDTQLKSEVNYVNANVNTHTIYLLDQNNYISHTKIRVQSKSKEGLARELIDALIQDGAGSDQIPSGFKSIINSNTKVNSIQITNNMIKVDLSDEFLDTTKDLEERTLEALVYTLTSIEGIDSIVVYLDGKILTHLPQNNIKLPATITRDIGINKEYNLTSLKDISYTTIYYVNKYNNDFYYTPVTKINNDTREKIDIIVDELSSRITSKGLMSFLNAKTTLLNSSIEHNTMRVNFDENIFNNLDQKDILEEVLYTIALSVNDNYKISEMVFKVHDEEIAKTQVKSLE